MSVDELLSISDLVAAGWHTQCKPDHSHFTYLIDYRYSCDPDIFPIPKPDFDIVPITATPEKFSGQLITLMKRLHKAKLTKKNQRAFIPILSAYIKSTHDYKKWRNQPHKPSTLHCLVMVYGKIGKKARVRAMVIDPTGAVLSKKQLMRIASKREAQDRSKHPEWFNQ